MKNKLIFLLLITTILTGCSSEQPRVKFDVEAYQTAKKITPIPEVPTVKATNYDLDLQLDTKQNTLSGNIVVIITNETKEALDKLCFRNYSATVLKETKQGVSKINHVMNADTKDVLSFSEQTDSSVIYVNTGLQPQETKKIKLSYQTNIPKINDRFGYHQDGNNKTYQLSFCFPVLATYQNGKWNETFFKTSGAETTYTPISNYQVTLKAPKDYTIVASGEETTKDNVTTIKADKIRDLAIIASNHMTIETKTIDGIQVNSCILNENYKKYNKFTMMAAIDSIDLFNQAFGKYCYQEIDVVHSFMSGGMEYPGLVMIGYPDSPNPDDGSQVQLCAVIAHEIAHQWFYGAIGNDSYKEPWLDEGFAEFCEDVLYQNANTYSLKQAVKDDDSDEFYGKQTPKEFKKWMKVLTEQTDYSFINKPYDQYNKDEYDYSQSVYTGGSLFLYELKEAMSASKFYYMMQQYYQTYCFKDVNGKAFIGAIKTYDDSKEVEAIINKYIDQSKYMEN